MISTESARETAGLLAKAILSLILLHACYSFLHHGWQAIAFRYPLDYQEGPLLDQIVRLARGENIYRPDLASPPYVVANYPPVFLLLQVPFVWVTPPAFWYGRLLSVASAVGTAICLGLTLHTLTRDRVAAITGSVLFLAIPYVTYWSSLSRVDSLALFLSWAALYLVVRWTDRRWVLVLAAGLFVAAAYTRQTYFLVAPFTAAAWLWHRQQRRQAVCLAAAVGGIGASLFVLFDVLSEGGFVFSVVQANAGEYRLRLLLSYFPAMLRHMPYLLISAILFILLAVRWRRDASWLAGPYLLAGGSTALLAGKIGSSFNYFFELSAALALSAALLLAWAPRRSWLRPIVMILLGLQIEALLHWRRTSFPFPDTQQETELEALNQIVRESEDPVLADEVSGLLPINGRPLYIELTTMAQLAQRGRWDQQPFLGEIRRREFSLILIYEPYAGERWTREARAQIEESYQPAGELAGNVLYRPRP